MKKLFAILIGLTITAIGTLALAADVPQYFGNVQWGNTTQPEHGVFIYGGAVRPDSNGDWFILDNATHEPLGLQYVTQDSEKVQVTLNNCYDEVSTSYAIADEGFAKKGWTPGLMMGLCEFTIWIYDQDGNIVDPADTYIPGDNLWILSVGTD